MRFDRFTTTALFGAAALLVSCTSDSTSAPQTTSPLPSTLPSATSTTVPGTTVPSDGFTVAKLSFFDSCPSLLDYMQSESSERVTAWGLGGGVGRWGDDMVLESTDVTGAPTSEQSANGSSSVAPDVRYSGTNTQEVGVDEGDIVETDGEYIYVVTADGLRVVAVSDAEVVATLDLPSGDHQLLLSGDRLTVVTSTWATSADTVVSLFDVSDPADPLLLRRSHLEGALSAARSVDGVVRLVLTSSFDQRLDFVEPSQFGLDETRALERNREIIATSTVDDWLPRWFDEAGDGSFGEMQPALDCSTVAAPAEFAGLGLTWVASFDVEADATPVGSAGVVSTSGTVYASPDNLYVSTVNWDWQLGVPTPASSSMPEPSENLTSPPTLIHQFELGEGTSATYVASGAVPGRLLNQFAMSEHNGDLRVATTTDGNGFGEQSESSVYVLRPVDGDLDVIGSVSGLGLTEQIRSVRFLGDTAYVVTFRQTDPLYVVDLSDPTNPVLDGELKIPGYSAYLHPVGDGLLLGVGQDATSEGRTLGTQLSLFDVSDPRNPQRVDTLNIGGSSEVEWDHRAFLFWPDDGTIVLPVSPGWNECLPGQDCLADKIVNSSGGAVVATLNGRELSARGVVTHSSEASDGCWNPLQRSLVVGSELVTVGVDQVKFSDLTTLDGRAVASWGTAGQYGCFWYE